LSFEPLSIEGIKKLKRIFEFFFSRLVNWHFFKLITSRKIGLLKLRNSADFLCMWIFFGRDRIIGIWNYDGSEISVWSLTLARLNKRSKIKKIEDLLRERMFRPVNLEWRFWTFHYWLISRSHLIWTKICFYFK
jgi:hypothetical protein